jgi:phage/plasmid primase-like uncharacterized protein
MIHEILSNHYHTLADQAEQCGINWNELHHSMTFDGRKVKHNRIAISRKYRGKCFAVGHKWTAKDGNEYPTIVFYTNKHGGITEVFNGFREHMANRGYSDAWIQKQMPPKIHQVEKTPIVEIEQWQIERLNNAHAAWNNATTDSINDYAYKNGSLNFEGVEVRRGIGRFGDCLMVQIFNIFGQVVGYQHIYDCNIREGSNKDIIGQYSGGFVVIGDRSKIKNGAWICEGLATGLSIYHAKGNGKDTLDNKRKLPVIVALSADNMKKVTKSFTALGNTDLRICADNDPSENGNAGQFTALQCAVIAGTNKYYSPENDGKKCDFNDTLNFTLYNSGKNQVEHIQCLMNFAPTGQLKKLGDRLSFAVARLVPYQHDEQAAIEIVEHALKSRKFEGKCNPAAIIRLSVAERREIVRKRNKITNFEGINRIKFDDMPTNEAILKKLIEQLDDTAIIFDTRGLGAGKTELLELLRKSLARGNKIAVITHRESLTYDLANRLNTDHYKEDDPSQNSQFLTLCVNSLPKFSIASRGYNILFIDEARQVLDHLIYGTVTNRQAAFDEFIAAIQAADFVFCSDADMNDDTVAFFRKHANGKLLHAIDAPAAENNKTLHMVDNHATNFVNISESLNDGKNVFVGCTSKNKAIEAYEFALHGGTDNLLLIHSENKDDPKQAAFLKNPNAEAINYRGVFHSPTIGSGVSITVDHFAINYLLNSGNLTENEALQMTARNRRATDIYVSCSDQSKIHLVDDFELMTEGKGKQAQTYLENFNGLAFMPNELGLLRIEASATKNHALNDYANNFYLLAEINGYAINRTPEQPAADVKEVTKGFATKVKEEIDDRIFNANDVDVIAAEKLSKHKQIERDQLDKLATKQMKGSDVIDREDIHRFKFDGVLKKLINHETVHASKKECVKDDELNHQTQDRSTYKTSIRKLSRAIIVERIAAQTIKNKSRRKLWLGLIEKVDPLRSMKALEKRLSKARLNSRDAQKICKYLKDNAAEIAANGLGNYDREFKRPMAILGGFIGQFGYEIEEVNRDENAHYFLIKPTDYISLYATNRIALKQ